MAEGMIGGTPIDELPASSFAYCEHGDGPVSARCHFPIRDKDGKPDAAHVRNAMARMGQSPFGEKARPKIEAAAHELGIGAMAGRSDLLERRDDLVRALAPEFTSADGEIVRSLQFDENQGGDAADGLGQLLGRFAVYDTWTEVNSVVEGHFMERTGEGTFRKTLSEKTPPIIFNHGWNPRFGTMPLAPTETIGEDQRGGFYGGHLLDTSYNRDLVPGLRAGLYGSSYRARPTRQDVVPRPKPSDYNPRGLPEVTLREAALREVGPGMFPVYADTTATVRSETDDYLLARFGITDPDMLRSLVAQATVVPAAPPTVDAGVEPHPDEGRRAEPAIASRFRSRDDYLNWLTERKTVR